jgi:hypothetical protein
MEKEFQAKCEEAMEELMKIYIQIESSKMLFKPDQGDIDWMDGIIKKIADLRSDTSS